MLASPRPGDWVAARKTFTASVNGTFLGRRQIRAGARGVVTEPPRGLLRQDVRVLFADGLGEVDVTAPTHQLTRIKRGGGVEEFRQRQTTVRWIRVALAALLLQPLIWFVVSYLYAHRSADGLAGALLAAVLHSAAATAEYALTNPLRCALFVGLSILLARFAFRR